MQTFSNQPGHWQYAPLAMVPTTNGTVFTGDLARVKRPSPGTTKSATYGQESGRVHITGDWQYALFLGLDLQRSDAATMVYAWQLNEGGMYWQSRETMALLNVELVADNQVLLSANIGMPKILLYTRPFKGMELAKVKERRLVANPLQEALVQNPYHVPPELAQNPQQYQARLATIRHYNNIVTQHRNNGQ